MKFEKPSGVLTEINQMLDANQTVQQNRARINLLFNGDPPHTESERIANRGLTNINWLEPVRIAQNSRLQMYNAFNKPGDYFTVRLDAGPKHKRYEWGRSITRHANRLMRQSRLYRSGQESAQAQVVLHGPGPTIWENARIPVPSTLGVEDVIVPAGTLASMENLDCLAIYKEWTFTRLYEMTHGPGVDRGWNTPYVDVLLKGLYGRPLEGQEEGIRWKFPEKVAEDWKEGTNYLAAALPKIVGWDFYYRAEDNKWNKRTVLEYDTQRWGTKNEATEKTIETLRKNKPEFLFEKDHCADDVDQIWHCYIGNCSNVAPFRYYSVRSIGYLLYGVCLIQNRMRNRMTDAIFEAMLSLFRNVSEDDREKLEQVNLHHLGIVPDGLSFVPAAERNQINVDLVMAGLQQNRQLMAESASNFLPDIAVEGEKPAMTATESLIRQNASVNLTSAVLTQMYNQSEPQYRECIRRFCIKGNPHPMAKKFRECLERDGVSLKVLEDPSYMEIVPERVMGGGNKAVELTTARALYEISPTLDPDAQRKAKRRYVLALGDDPNLADELVPEGGPPTSDAAVVASLAFGSLMQGVPILMQRGLAEVPYIDTLLKQMALAIKQVPALLQSPNSLSNAAEKITGLVNVGAHIEERIMALASDAGLKDRVAAFNESLAELMEQLRVLSEQYQKLEQEAAQQQGQGGLPPEAQGKIVASGILAEAKARTAEAAAAQKREHKDLAFAADQDRKNVATMAEQERKMAMTQAEVEAKDLKTKADVIATVTKGTASAKARSQKPASGE